ncbi:Mucin [Heterostelium album PN500]|uniref:Mucin n=1 Tax=Heterostelium pallidum (strain ATCC 26659 / Pp 5 / PN500) TaxID=670386 RepID=D3AZ89_HETP5|nr:Mucin [Heterostelium album PN500]EFA85472.1 Mucin [Heterostelium album PN500]|eukprot:XP_020437580.1 Mucin [Heterostelium album PN500]
MALAGGDDQDRSQGSHGSKGNGHGSHGGHGVGWNFCRYPLRQFFEEAKNQSCITISGNALSDDGSQVSFKGNLKYDLNSSSLVQSGNIVFLSSSDYQCNDQVNLVQPFLVNNATTFSEFSIDRNGELTLGNDTTDIECLFRKDIFIFEYEDIAYTFVLTVNKNCSATNFGEQCSTPTPTPTSTPTSSPNVTVTPTPTETPTSSPNVTVTPTETPTSSPNVTVTPTPTETPTSSPNVTVTPTETPTSSPNVTVTPTETPTSSPNVTVTPTETPTSSPNITDTPIPTETPTSSPNITDTPIPTETPTSSPNITDTPIPTETPTSSPNITDTPIPTETPTQTPLPSVSIKLNATNSWAEGNETATQYNVDVTNNGTSDITSLTLVASNFQPTSIWNIVANGTEYSLPSNQTIQAGATYQWGFITLASTEPEFSVKQ